MFQKHKLWCHQGYSSTMWCVCHSIFTDIQFEFRLKKFFALLNFFSNHSTLPVGFSPTFAGWHPNIDSNERIGWNSVTLPKWWAIAEQMSKGWIAWCNETTGIFEKHQEHSTVRNYCQRVAIDDAYLVWMEPVLFDDDAKYKIFPNYFPTRKKV